jgi:hypothetical protein
MNKTIKSAILSASSAVALLAWASASQARDDAQMFPFNEVVERGFAEGKLDGTVKFYLAGSGPKGGTVVRGGMVTNKKTNSVGKDDKTACDWALISALVQLQGAAKNSGANAVTNIVSFYQKKETSDATNYECHSGGFTTGVALKGDAVKM